MLSESNLRNLPQAKFETGLTDALTRDQDPRDKAKEDREKLVKTREMQAQEFQDSVSAFRTEYQEISTKNYRILADFRKNAPSENMENVTKYLSKINELEQKNGELKDKLEAYSVESKGRWISFKYEYKHDMMEFEKAIKTFSIDHV